MAQPRKQLVCPSTTPYYHVTSRCVRRAWLCGVDRVKGRSYEHRRGWIEDRIRVLASLFSIELCAYAIMSNHYHLVVKLVPQETDQWTDRDVVEPWTSPFKGPLLIQRYAAGESLLAVEKDTVRATIAVYRQRLGSLSWFMKCLNEPIARKANAEDRCTGHFWEARFHSQPLISERALLSAMAYVDLNPVRAGMAATPEESDYTSIKARLDRHVDVAGYCASTLLESGELRQFRVPVRPLAAFEEDMSPTPDGRQKLPMRWSDYLTLVDSAGRAARGDKRYRIDSSLQSILARLRLNKAS